MLADILLSLLKWSIFGGVILLLEFFRQRTIHHESKKFRFKIFILIYIVIVIVLVFNDFYHFLPI
ncbi:MAG: hypothetical protein A2Y45_08100 [Tenericutes bacterium GWC2_34_14]|nr:MAG: hypothetical protein A2Z84_07095 [Tenericutes bacterium GWA2_35_7]OHE29859.1 MAG: hypothetical protein A2Y45_08100 [Tenericutes bacterium GWC2_34_14]OHE34838.1 MAG: hypothetical protein A2012_01710 [Tenericutes bacterium GWE2_34_108]OHE37301.1 MAG: hypothetical protein A2Y46_01300 [Tenericutes bacterium GWF1_35_14]OHE39566.1 MAG: hypothetical protein A2Y44_01560 [Tenericutes bacterium GWF2_35_184]OHE43166.1 MAG: hypothetical protein A3K26_03045 [Tenericutes bacterium RIFOXYA12_FULL_35_